MTRVLQSPAFDLDAIDVPAPPAWDSVAHAAFAQGYQNGVDVGRAAGRRDLMLADANLRAAVEQSLGAIEAALHEMNQRVLEVSEMFVTTVLRHLPEARTAGLLVRMGEALSTFDPGSVTVSVEPNSVAGVADAFVRRPPRGYAVMVVSDANLAPGEFLIHSDWADAEGTLARYVDAAREALALNLALDSGVDAR